MTSAVYKIEHDVKLDKVELEPFRKPRLGEPSRVEVFLTAERVKGCVSEAKVSINQPTWANFSITADEGTYIGGGNTAPCPLHYFCSGIAFCFLSHVNMYCDMCDIHLDKITAELRMKFSLLDEKTKVKADGLSGSSDGLEFHLVVESDESEETIQKVFDECMKACVAMQSIANPVPIESHLHHNGVEL